MVQKAIHQSKELSPINRCVKHLNTCRQSKPFKRHD